MCEHYLLLNHKDDIIKVLEHPVKEKYFSAYINFLELFESDTNLGNALLTDPEVSLKNWNEAIFNVQSDLLNESNKYTLKNNVNCRIYNLPPWPHVCRTIFPGNDDADQFLQVTGIVVRMSARKLLEYQRQYICVQCKFPITVQAKYDRRNSIKQPKKCPNPEGCSSKNIISFGELDVYNCKDYQEIKIQEDLSKLGVGTIPNHMIVTLEDDLVNVCKPGENVTITGIVTRRWSEFDKGAKIIIDIALKANHIQVNNSSGLSLAISDDMKQFFQDFWERHLHEPLIGRNIILKSISPEIYGLHLVKLATALVLAGGSRNEENKMSTGIDTRAESHLLLVGDPGTGKSQMLRFASKIIPRSVLTTGVGSTAAGLTVTAVMEDGDWQLEAGALVMADGGICCIDEFNSMREHDRTSIHEAMEQQTISVAKAGLVCKLKTRCSILAACNPKGNIDPTQPLCVNVAMSSPLLSRFDLILLIRDIVNEENDLRLAEHLLNKGSQLSGDGTMWSLEKLQAYYAIIKKKNPKLTKAAETILSTYYQLQRKFGGRNKSRTTVRRLESIIRLSQGHAKLMFHSEVQVMDAIFAITLTDTAMDFESSVLNLKLDNNSLFENPEQQYWDLLEVILGKLNLDYIYQKEIEKIGVDTGYSQTSSAASISQLTERTSPGLFTGRGLFSQDSVHGIAKRPKPLFTQRYSEESRRAENTNQITSSDDNNSRSFSQDITNNKNLPYFSALDKSEVSEKLLNDSKDSGNCSDLVSLNSQHFCQSNINKNNSVKKIPNRFMFKKTENKQNENIQNTLLSENCLDRPSTSKDTKWSKKMKVSQKSSGVAENTMTEGHRKPLTLSEIVRSRSELDFDMDFDLNFENISSSFNKNKVDASKSIKGVPISTSSKTNLHKEDDKLADGTKSVFKKRKESRISPIKNEQNTLELENCLDRPSTLKDNNITGHRKPTLSELVRSRSKLDFDMDFDLNYENISSDFNKNKIEAPKSINKISKTNLDKEVDKMADGAKQTVLNSSTKNCPISPIKQFKKPKIFNKKKVENEMDLVKLMPSVNDDFLKFDMNIDWNMDEDTNASENMNDDDQQKTFENNDAVCLRTNNGDKETTKVLNCDKSAIGQESGKCDNSGQKFKFIPALNNIDLNIENSEFVMDFCPFGEKASKVNTTTADVTEKNDLFDMTQNSRKLFIGNKFNFKKVDVKIPKSDSTNSTD